MDVRQVDPRDIGWEVESLVYRVYFWEPSAPPPDVSEQVGGWRSDEFEVSEVDDVTEVLAWAKATATPRRAFTVYAVVEGERERGLVRLAGVDPTRSTI